MFWLILSSYSSGIEGQCTRKELDRVGEEVALCVIRQQEMVTGVERIFVGSIYTQEALCVMVGNIKDKCVPRWGQCYHHTQVGAA